MDDLSDFDDDLTNYDDLSDYLSNSCDNDYTSDLAIHDIIFRQIIEPELNFVFKENNIDKIINFVHFEQVLNVVILNFKLKNIGSVKITFQMIDNENGYLILLNMNSVFIDTLLPKIFDLTDKINIKKINKNIIDLVDVTCKPFNICKKYYMCNHDYNETLQNIIDDNNRCDDLHICTGSLFYEIICTIIDTCNNATDRCAICEKNIGIAMPKISICDKELCIHSYESFGIGINDDDIHVNELLYHLAFAAFTQKGVFELPKFIVSDLGISNTNVVSDDLTNANNILKNEIDICKFLKSVKYGEKPFDYNHNNLLKKVLMWIIASNRSVLEWDDVQKCFLIQSNPPEKEIEFQELKKIHGSFTAFHGSPLFNWLNILKTGLTTQAKTLHGNAYGKGLYFADKMDISRGYARVLQNRFAKNMAIIAECEIIKAPEILDIVAYIKPGHPFIRVLNDSYVKIIKLYII